MSWDNFIIVIKMIIIFKHNPYGNMQHFAEHVSFLHYSAFLIDYTLCMINLILWVKSSNSEGKENLGIPVGGGSADHLQNHSFLKRKVQEVLLHLEV